MERSRKVAPVTRRAFTLVELLVGTAISAVLLGTLILLAFGFTRGFLSGEDTFSTVQEASTLVTSLRRDLAAVALRADGSDLDVTLSPGALKLKVPGAGGPPRSVEYRHDARRGLVVREEESGPAVSLGQGMVEQLEVSQVYLVRSLSGDVQVKTRVAPGERPWRAGVRIALKIRGTNPGPHGGSPRSLEIVTHTFPVFANRALSSLWKRNSL